MFLKRARMSHLLISAVAAVVLCAALSACSGLQVLDALVPRKAAASRDIAYGAAPRQMLDVYMPKGMGADAKLPVVLFFYGGSWTSGSRGEYRFAGEALAGLGYVAVVADYRLYPSVKFPVYEYDAGLALRWTLDHIASYGGDPAAIFIMGHSAGAHLAALLAVDPAYARAAGVPDHTIKGFIGLAGPYDMVPSQVASVRDVFAGLPDENVARPVRFVTPENAALIPPMLLLYGLADKTVERGNAVEMARLMREVGRPVTLKEYPDVGHPGIVLAMTPLFRGRAPVLVDTKAFIDGLMAAR